MRDEIMREAGPTMVTPKKSSRRHRAAGFRLLVVIATLCIAAGLVSCSPSPVGAADLEPTIDVQLSDDTGSDSAIQVVTVFHEGTAGAVISVPTDSVSEYATDIEIELSLPDLTSEYVTRIALAGNSASVGGAGAVAQGSIVYVSMPGTYAISGTLDDGQIIVNADNDGTVYLVLGGAEIHNMTGPAIYVKDAGQTVIVLVDGSHNVVTDGAEYYFTDPSADEPNSAIFSEDDLIITGTGELTIHGAYNNAVMSKDDLVIAGGVLMVEAADDGLIGRDRVVVLSGDIAVSAGGDAIRSTNDTDPAKGFIAIEAGALSLTAGANGIQAETAVNIADGTIEIDSGDDAVHKNGTIVINGGGISIDAGDDAFHADKSIEITGGDLDITRRYEGIESAMITISGGAINVVSSDDAINVVGAAREQAFAGRMPVVSADQYLVISGGSIAIRSAGDGLDINGSVFMSDGTMTNDGPVSNANGALDYDGVFELSGGFIVAAGSSGMAQAPSEQSTESSVAMTYSRTQTAGAQVSLVADDGSAIAAFTPTKQYQSVVIASPELTSGQSYTLYSDSTPVVTFTLSGTVTWLTESGVTNGPSGGFGPGGFAPGGRVPGVPDNRRPRR
jgi:hypothetical protein